MKEVKSYLAINKIIEVEVNPHTPNSRSYQTRIEDINEKGIVIATPMEQGALVNLSPDTTVILWHNDYSASYAHYCQVKARILEPLPLTFLDWPQDIKKVQRRNFVRVPASIKLDFSTGQRDEKGREIYHSTTTGDISGGGLKFTTSTLMPKSSPLKVRLYLPEEETIEIMAKIAWIVNLGQPNKYLVGIEFTKISEGLRDKIIRYVFIRQRDLIKKGLLER